MWMDILLLCGILFVMGCKASISPTMFDLLGNAFGLLILVEYGSMCATYMLQRLYASVRYRLGVDLIRGFHESTI